MDREDCKIKVILWLSFQLHFFGGGCFFGVALDVTLLAFFRLLPVFLFSHCPEFQDLWKGLATRLILQCQSGITAFSADLRLLVTVLSLSNNCIPETVSRL